MGKPACRVVSGLVIRLCLVKFAACCCTTGFHRRASPLMFFQAQTVSYDQANVAPEANAVTVSHKTAKPSLMQDLREDQACTDLCAVETGWVLASRFNRTTMNTVNRVTSGTATVKFSLTRCTEGRG